MADETKETKAFPDDLKVRVTRGTVGKHAEGAEVPANDFGDDCWRLVDLGVIEWIGTPPAKPADPAAAGATPPGTAPPSDPKAPADPTKPPSTFKKGH
jgi:hypothetical protein